MQSGQIRKALSYIPSLLKLTFNLFPISRAAIGLVLAGIFLEYLTLSVMLMFAAGSQNAHSHFTSKVIDIWKFTVCDLMGFNDVTEVWVWIFILLFGLRILIGYIQIGLSVWISKKMLSFFSTSSLERVLSREPMELIYQNSVGFYAAIAGDESARIGQIFYNFIQLISNVISALIGLLMLCIFSINIFLITLIFLLFSALIFFISLGKIVYLSNEATQLSRVANTTFIEAFNGLRSIRSIGGESYVSSQYQKQQNRYDHVLFLLEFINHSSRILPALLLIIIALLVLYPSNMLIGGFSAIYFFSISTMLIRVLSFLGGAVSSGGKMAIDIRVAYDLNDMVYDHQGSNKVKPLQHNKRICNINEVAISNLSYSYQDGRAVLLNVSGTLKAGSTYAIVGKSGSGKSTLADLLLGLIAPRMGGLEINGIPYDRIELSDLRRSVVLVEQQTRIFTGTIRENIEFGLTFTDSQLAEAINAVDLDSFIKTLPEGIDTPLDYQGSNLSGGQRQRIGLARAFIRKPDVLILDEATSALDVITRDRVLKCLRSVFQNKILLFITHDSNVVDSADQIWRIESGNIFIYPRRVD